MEIKVYGRSYPEFLVFHNLTDNNESLLKYMKYGGLPSLINLELEDHIVYDYLQNIYNSILYKDVVRRFRIRNLFFSGAVNGILCRQCRFGGVRQEDKRLPEIAENFHFSEIYYLFRTITGKS